jgi:hypothetical protein
VVVVVVVDSVFFVSAGGFTKEVVLFSIFLSAGGFTTVVLVSVFFSAGGLTVVVFCSHAPKSAALARMQISFFIDLMGVPVSESKEDDFAALPNLSFNRARGLGDDDEGAKLVPWNSRFSSFSSSPNSVWE